MKSITIHKLDTDLANAIEQLSAQSGLSQNKLVKRLLRSALGLDSPVEPPNDFERFCGIWSEEDALDFDTSMQQFDEIDEELWH